MQRTCNKCDKTLDISEFYRHPKALDGLSGKCKECTKVGVRANYRKNRDHYVAYEQARQKNPERRQAALGYQRTRRERHPEKYHARMAVDNAVRDGRLTRKPCEVCGTTDRVQAHHDDYSKPFDVKWLCFKHHREVEHGQVVTELPWPKRDASTIETS